MKTLKRLFYIIVILLLASILYKNDAFDTIKENIKVLFNNVQNSTGLLSLEAVGNLVNENELTKLEDSHISGKDYSFDPLYYPYYGMLSSDGQRLYKQVYANAIELESTFVPIVIVDKNDVKNVVEAVFNDHPELFWLENNYNFKYVQTGQCVQILLNFNDTSLNIENSKNEFDKAADQIITEALKLNSDYAKEKYVHDTLIKMINYDSNSALNQTAYSALVNKNSVCAGYAKSFQYIMTKLNIPTYFVVGYAKENHGWNIIKLDDGYYNVDLTWDDVNTISYKYFNVTDEYFYKTHQREGLSINLPTCKASKYKYIEPKKYEQKKEEISNQTDENTTTIIDESAQIEMDETTSEDTNDFESSNS